MDTTHPPTPQPGRPAPPAASGLVLGRYRLRSRLGSGGFGTVWRAVDERLEREVAVKVIRAPSTPGEGRTGPAPELRRAEREARTAARLNHPGVVALYELGRDADAVYLVSEFVDGPSLDELEHAGALADRDVAEVGLAVADALAHAHARGVVHRDVKPHNILVVARPAVGAGFAKLTDFGVAHLASAEPLTGTGDLVGTLAYMSPEQAEGAPITPAADVYALALTLLEAWTGANPVRGANLAATSRRLGRRLPGLSSLRPDLPGSLARALDAALVPDPDRRATLGELATAIFEVVERLDDREGLADLDDGAGPDATTRIEPPSEMLPAPRPRAETAQTAWLPRHVPVLPGAGGHRLPRAPTGPHDDPEDLVDEPRGGRFGRLALDGVQRLAAGAGAGALVLAILVLPAPQTLEVAKVLAGVTALAVALFPRLGWLAGVGAAVLGLALGPAGAPGLALVLLAGLAPIPVLLPRAGRLWSLPGLAPLLGTVGLAPAFLALAALPRQPWRRAALAATGFAAVLVLELLLDRVLLLGPPAGTAEAGGWRTSPGEALTDALAPLAAAPTVLGTLVWAALALTLPLAVRGRSLRLDLARGAAWVALTVVGHAGVAESAGAGAGVAALGGALVALVAALVLRLSGLLDRAGEGKPRPEAAI